MKFETIANTFSSPSIVHIYQSAVKEVGIWRSELFLIKKYLNVEKRILVIGCGAGRVPINLYKKGYQNVEGIDLSPEMIHTANAFCKKERIPIKFETANAINLPFKKKAFDAVLMPYNTLSHIPDSINRERALKESYRVLKTNGYLFFTVHEDRNSTEKWKQFWIDEKRLWEEGKQDPRLIEYGDTFVKDKTAQIFIHVPKNEEIVSMLKKSGFTIVETFLRSQIIKEPERVISFSGDCRWWVSKIID